ncbi:MAG TPA: class I SAM-dependent methyltransferase [Gemmataceae bacterium]|jgi:ubiquinone/menaquinone biosynthesis C-methylase UbiE|nr:class I SAM-dependent methyltransferase [Gemmataceae bacterium]
MASSPPDWRLPPGVTRGLWDYLHDADLARGYDASLAGSSLVRADVRFAEGHFDRPGRLIDLGCGTGRLALAFARRGYWVVGVDLSEEMLRQAGARAGESGVVLHRVKANLVELGGLADQSFDYAACLFSTLGMISGAGNRQRVLAHVHRLLRPGGKFVLHVHNRWFNFWNREGRAWLFKDFLRSCSRRKDRGDRLMPVHQGVAGLTLHLFTRAEARRMLHEAGFQLLEIVPVGLGNSGELSRARLFPGLRAYGYLLAGLRRN